MDAAPPTAKRRSGRWRLLPERGTISLFELLLLVVCVALVAVPLPQYLQDVVIQTFLWAGLALAWNIAGGFAGLISFGHAAFFGIGAYTSSILAANYGLTPWIGLWIGGVLAAAFGAVLTLVCARLRGPFFILSTLAAAEVVRIAALNWATLTGGAEGFSILPVASIANMVFEAKTTYAALMLGYFLVIYAITKTVEGSRYGYYLFAARDDEEAASAAGVNPLLARTGAMCLSAFLAGIGGSLFAQYFLFLDPDARDLARTLVSVRAPSRTGRPRHGDRAGARFVRHHAAVRDAALLFRRRGRGPASCDLRRRARGRDALFSERHCRRAAAAGGT